MPANLNKKEISYLKDTSIKIFKSLFCNTIVRIDFLGVKINSSIKFYFLEVNTHPGLTKLSLSPEQAQHEGISYLNLLKIILRDAS